MNYLPQWFYSLESREKNALILGSLSLLVMGIYYFLWMPFNEEKQSLKNIVTAQKSTLAWMHTAATEIQQLQQKSPVVPILTTSLLSLVEQSSTLLGKVDKRIEPQGEQAVKITIDKVSFTQLMKWLGQLYNQQEVDVRQIHIEKQKEPDIISVRLTLTTTI